MILGSTFEEEKETTENAGDAAAVSGFTAAVAVDILGMRKSLASTLVLSKQQSKSEEGLTR